MSKWEKTISESDEWYTPPDFFMSLGCSFDLDPCSPGLNHWVPALNIYTKKDNGLLKPWYGFVYMNPPFGGRNGHIPWLKKFISHNNGIGVVRAYTSAAWFHDYIKKTDLQLFPKGKTKFIKPDGTIGKSPGHGIIVLGMGQKACNILKQSNLGLTCNLKS